MSSKIVAGNQYNLSGAGLLGRALHMDGGFTKLIARRPLLRRFAIAYGER